MHMIVLHSAQMWQVQLDLVLQQLHQLSSRSASREDLDEIRAKTRQMQEQQQSQVKIIQETLIEINIAHFSSSYIWFLPPTSICFGCRPMLVTVLVRHWISD